MIGFVIGNGESRKYLDLNLLKPYGRIFGCNALYRDFIPDVLVTVDERMIQIVESDNVADQCEVIKRHVGPDNVKLFKSSRGVVLPDLYHAAAGPSALYIMCDRLIELTKVYLVGFDIFSNNGKVNNIYKDTEGYVTSDSPATYTGNWIEKLGRIFLAYQHINFYHVSNNVVERWEKISNVTRITYDMMLLGLKNEETVR